MEAYSPSRRRIRPITVPNSAVSFICPTHTDHLSLTEARAGRYRRSTTPNPGLGSMLLSISSVHAKSCMTLLLWAHILRLANGRKVVVDDSETDKIIYSKGWAEYTGCVGCTQAPNLTLAYNGSWHTYVAHNSDNQLALINLSQLGRVFKQLWRFGLQF